MEYLILGLLMLSPMTGYDLQQFIKKNLALICSHSAGSVQIALAKLEKEGKVTTCESAQGKRRKKIFSITDTGRTAFSSWVAQPMQADIYVMQGMMKADHKFYKAHGIYDFPQKQKKRILQMKLVGAMLAVPSVQKKIKGQMNQYIIGPYEKVVEQARGNNT